MAKRKRKGPSLRDMAAEAKAMIEANPEMRYVHRKLSHGLELVLERLDESRWRLAAARAGEWPSEAEIGIVRLAFDVPSAVEEERSTINYVLPKTGRTITYHRVECRWIDYQTVEEPVAA